MPPGRRSLTIYNFHTRTATQPVGPCIDQLPCQCIGANTTRGLYPHLGWQMRPHQPHRLNRRTLFRIPRRSLQKIHAQPTIQRTTPDDLLVCQHTAFDDYFDYPPRRMCQRDQSPHLTLQPIPVTFPQRHQVDHDIELIRPIRQRLHHFRYFSSRSRIPKRKPDHRRHPDAQTLCQDHKRRRHTNRSETIFSGLLTYSLYFNLSGRRPQNGVVDIGGQLTHRMVCSFYR